MYLLARGRPSFDVRVLSLNAIFALFMPKSYSGSRWLRRWNATNVLGAMIVLGLIALLVPRNWLSWIRIGGQSLRPFQHGAAVLLDGVSDPMSAVPPVLSVDDYLTMTERLAALERLYATLTDRVRELEEEKKLLLASRRAGLGARGELIPALLLGVDPAWWRRTAMIDRGAWAGVPSGAPVSTQHAVMDRGEADGVANGLAVLQGEVLLGVVIEVHTLTSRVQLISDPATQLRVRIGGWRDGVFTLPQTSYWMTGGGDDRMIISDVPRADVESGMVRKDDTVLAQPVESLLPVAMVVGTVETIEPDLRNPLLSRLIVRSAVPFDRVRRVYVYRPE